jgi:very-short-patch-repair endonuclease
MKSLLEFAPEIRKQYEDEKKSIRAIAKTFGTYPIAVYRTLVSIGVKIRDKSDAAKEALSSGRATHPTQGKKLSTATKSKIGNSVATAWDNMSEVKKEAISEKHKEIWKDKTDEEKQELSKKSHKAIAESARIGSKMERYLVDAINSAGYQCFPHVKILQNLNLEVDLCLPNLKIAVELDGPSHFAPIWGDDIFAKTKEADREKNGLLALNGYKVIRIVYTKGHVSNVLKEKTLKLLIDKIEEAKESSENLFIVHV